MSALIGIDIGGTNIVCGLVDVEGRLISKKKLPTEVNLGSEYVITKIARMCNDLLAEANLHKDSIIAGGAGTPGFIDPDRGIIKFAGNLQWKNVPLADHLSAQTGFPVYVNNDVRMYMYGEAVKGAGQGYNHVLGITIGTGLSEALVSHGEIYHGGGFLAGEMGHIPMEGVTEICSCGMTGCLETIVSATGIARQARQAIMNGRESVLQQWHPDLAEITAEDVSKAYDLGDETAISVMQYTGSILGRGLSYAVPLLSPDLIVIGGGGAMAGERLFAPMRKELQQRVHPIYWERLHIKSAQWIDDAGVIGSALYAKAKSG
jgi:glucokinase